MRMKGTEDCVVLIDVRQPERKLSSELSKELLSIGCYKSD